LSVFLLYLPVFLFVFATVTYSNCPLSVVVDVGCGVNVTNKDPTVCINDLLCRLNGVESASQPEPFTVEELIARSLSALEELIDKFETEDWRQVVDEYYTYWLHRQVIAMMIADVSSG